MPKEGTTKIPDRIEAARTRGPQILVYNIYIYEVRRKPRTRNLKESSFYYLGAFMFQESWDEMPCQKHAVPEASRKGKEGIPEDFPEEEF